MFYNKIKNLIKQAFYKTVDSDSTAYPKGEAQYNGKVTKFTRMSIYGVYSNPPKDSHILLFNSQGQESNKFGFTNDFLNRKKNLEEAQVAIGNTSTNMIISFKDKIAIGNDILPMISTPPKTGVEVLEILDRILTLLQAPTNLAGINSGVSFLPATLSELAKLQIDLNSLKGSL